MSQEDFRQSQSVSDLIEGLKRKEEDRLKRVDEEKQKRVDESKRVMTELGVTSIFEELRDNEKLTYYRDQKYQREETPFGYVKIRSYVDKIFPAIINYNSKIAGATISFDAKREQDKDGPNYYFSYDHRVSVEKRDSGIYVVAGRFGIFSSEYNRCIITYKLQPKNQLPELIAQAIYTIKPNVQLSSPPERVEWI